MTFTDSLHEFTEVIHDFYRQLTSIYRGHILLFYRYLNEFKMGIWLLLLNQWLLNGFLCQNTGILYLLFVHIIKSKGNINTPFAFNRLIGISNFKIGNFLSIIKINQK
jgi:hypothetical protein